MSNSKPNPQLTSLAVEQKLWQYANPEKAAFFPRFFRTGQGEYGEGDQFIGVVVPDQRKVAKSFKALPADEIKKLLDSPLHECRLTALLILVDQFQRAKEAKVKKVIYDFYVKNVDRVNNWDLVDTSCHKIMGPYLMERSRTPLFKFAKAKHLWKNRISIVTTYYFIKRDDFGTTIDLATELLDHEHNLIHKAVGWMLREMGNQDEELLLEFLKQHSGSMPRTMLRYSIERLPKDLRSRILNGTW